MNILSIDKDGTLAMDSPEVMGDSQVEARLWGQHVSKLEIITFSFSHQRLKARKISNNVHVYPTSSHAIFIMPFDAYKIGKRICRQQTIDLITAKDPFFAGLCGLWLKKEFRIPLNIRLHGNALDNQLWLNENPIHIVFNALGHYVVNQADRILSVHPDITKNIRKVSKKEKPLMFTLKNDVGIDIDRFSHIKLNHIRPDILPDNKNFLILYAGRLEKEKNIKNLLVAMKSVIQQKPGAFLVILGDGSERTKLLKLCHHLHINKNVRFYGAVPYSQMPDFINASDVVVLPSNHEGGGRIIVEALLMERPVVATHVGLAGDILKNSINGFLLQSNRAEDIANGLMKAIDQHWLNDFDDDYVQSLHEKFNRTAIISEIIAAWEKTVNNQLS